MGVDPRDRISSADDARRASKGSLGGRPVAAFEQVREIVGALVPDRRGAGLCRLSSVGDRRQRLVINDEQIGHVPSLRARRWLFLLFFAAKFQSSLDLV
jgi:hypothetical protein